ncbi:hypothetical protein AgCh_022224 [Apium graveolens]
MSDQGEKTCPLCAEEMDLTDQQLKPCKCGYDICVWCWHHIMDMAEKDGTEGRCPACRTSYNKEKIVETSAKFERLVAEMSMEKKTKAKSKSKTSDGRKQLTSVRVVQRNLVYIMGLPLDLADEDLLQGKEYFAQYGKVLKVSISRTSAGTIQQFPNETCSVYITYSKEEEAVRCIQSVHGFTLDGRPLKACFGTTKYCHAWLRNAPCNNRDCLYLHEIGSHEVSFSKDEIISSYTRNKVQQISSAPYDPRPRSGNVLPPPADEFSNNHSSSGKPSNKIATINTDLQSDNILGASVWQTPASSVRSSPPNSSSGRSASLPAAASWGVRTSNSQPPSLNVASSNGPFKQKSDSCSGSLAFSTVVANPTQVSAIHSDVQKKPNEAVLVARQKVKLELAVSEKVDHRTTSHTLTTPGHPVTSIPSVQCIDSLKDKDDSPNMSHKSEKVDCRTTSYTHATPGQPVTSVPITQYIDSLKDKNDLLNMPHNPVSSYNNYDVSRIGAEKEPVPVLETKFQKVCSDMQSLRIDGPRLQRCISEQHRDPLSLNGASNTVTSHRDAFVSREHSELRSHEQSKVAGSTSSELEDDLLSFNVQRIKDPEVVGHRSNLPSLSQSFNHKSRILSANFSVDPLTVNNKTVDKSSLPKVYNIPSSSNGYTEILASKFTKLDNGTNNSYMPSDGGKHDTDDIGESSIISNILSMDFDSWDDPLSSPRNLAKLLGEAENKQRPHGASTSWKVQTSNQSRFSFAREDNEMPKFEPSFSNFGQSVDDYHSFGNGFSSNGDYYLGKSNNLSSFNTEDPGDFANNNTLGSNKFPVSRAPASAPPGFSGPARAPPPGFTERIIDPSPDMDSGGYSLEQFLSRKTYPANSQMNIGSAADIEFMDPAILAVGKGRLPGGHNSLGLDMRSRFPQQMYGYENEAQELLMQRSLNSHKNQNHRYAEMSGNFSSHPEYYGSPKNLSSFSQFSRPQSRNQLISNGNWDGWNEVQGMNELSMAELLRSERMGINNLFNGYEDSKYRMAGSGDLFNQTYRFKF